MVINNLRGRTLFLDTAPLIYFIEGNSSYQDKLLELFTLADRNELTFLPQQLHC